MFLFWVSDLSTWIRTAARRIQQLPGVQKFIFDAKFGILTQKHINLTYVINFGVNDLYIWIRLAPSRIQELPGVRIYDSIL